MAHGINLLTLIIAYAILILAVLAASVPQIKELLVQLP